MSSAFADILDQYAEEAAMLWLRRDRAVWQFHYGLRQLAKLDEQLAAQLDGLRLAGEEGWQAAVGELHWQEPAELFAPAVLAFHHRDARKIDFLLEQLGICPVRIRPLISALGWCEFEQIQPTLEAWLTSREPLLRRIALAGFSAQRYDPGDCLPELLTDSDPAVCCQAAYAVAELGRMDALPQLETAMLAAEPALRRAAAWSASRWHHPSAAQTLAGSIPASWQDLLGLSSSDECCAEHQLKQWFSTESTQRLAICLIGVLGRLEFVPDLLAAMHQPHQARLAYAVWTLLTGIAARELEAAPPAELEFGPTDDPADDDVTPDPDAHLPWPNPEAITEVWQRQSAEWPQQQPVLYGRLRTRDWLQEVLLHGNQPARALAAWELAKQSRSEKLWEVRAVGGRQLAWLGQGPAWSAAELHGNDAACSLNWDDEDCENSAFI